MKTKLIITTFIASWLSIGSMQAQVSKNPNKFLGNITTRGGVDAGNGVPSYYTLWNQITCENESKWASVEGTKGSYNWSGADRAFNYAKNHNFTYKFHALVWGSQYPSWLENLSPKDRLSAMTKWFDKAKEKYNTLPMIDVVNEAVGNHQPGNPMMKETLGGGGKTGFDWLIKAFDMAGERWPDAILIYNDYNSLRHDVDNYITLVRTLRDAGAPIDAYGNQSHDVNDISTTELSNVLKKQQDAQMMPMFITELDIDKADDAQQKAQYQKVLPLMWEAPYCAGVTLWGYVHGATWVDNSGLYKNGAERSAMTWIKEYMETDAAKTAVGPFPGTKKEASIYIRPLALRVAKDDVLPIQVNARLATKTIKKVDFYLNGELIKTMTEAPYVLEVTSSKTGWNDTKAVVTATDDTTYERYGRFQVVNTTTKRSPYNEKPFEIPGTINITEYDKGVSNITYMNASRNKATATKDGQWMDYTVDIKEDGLYSFDATIAATTEGGMFHVAEYGLDKLTFLTDYIDVPKTGGSTNWKTMHGQMVAELKAGRHILTVLVDKGGFYFDKLTLTRFEESQAITSCNITNINPLSPHVGDSMKLTVTIKPGVDIIKEVKLYVNNFLADTMTEAPYVFNYVPTVTGAHIFTVIATDNEGKQKVSSIRKITVKESTGIQTVSVNPDATNNVYNLYGVKVGTMDGWQSMPRGIYVVNGRKVTK